MTVEFIPRSKHCFGFGIANETWFHLLKTSKIREILNNPPLSNDPIRATKKQALACAEAIKNRQPIEFRFSNDIEKIKLMFIDFFEKCNGFSTY